MANQKDKGLGGLTMTAILIIQILLAILTLLSLWVVILIRRVWTLEQYAADCRINAVENDEVAKYREAGL